MPLFLFIQELAHQIVVGTLAHGLAGRDIHGIGLGSATAGGHDIDGAIATGEGEFFLADTLLEGGDAVVVLGGPGIGGEFLSRGRQSFAQHRSNGLRRGSGHLSKTLFYYRCSVRASST